MDWWLWLVIGVILLVLEMLTPGALFLVFFGVAAIVVGLLATIGAAGPLWTQILLFAVLSLVSLLALRRMFVARLRISDKGGSIDKLVGETALALDDMPVNSIGKAELRGSSWSARNVGESTVSNGQRCTVVGVEGLTLWILGD